ncbi:hypothetical protein RFI_25260 [Reticulomyxa filosa]|uniref:Uncharacterized protein n=1 Tax=Reticulomyxa filosa TaxID=46433 RepID=X6MGD5_RETFI|nr:hypothetical protein RFI_25260 [Reticulomyxa filosa]|eukprot:ETO12115.1 hypothetical protein RFI_25260 [Reticulomyxa filosa]
MIIFNVLERTISLTIRNGDKCAISLTAEMKCVTIKQFVKVVEILTILDHNIDTVIVTSESQQPIDEFVTDLQHSEYADIHPRVGHLAWLYFSKQSRYDFAMSILSSVQLQMFAKYYIVTHESNWCRNIWYLSSNLYCNPYIKYTKQWWEKQRQLYLHNNNNSYVDIEWNTVSKNLQSKSGVQKMCVSLVSELSKNSIVMIWNQDLAKKYLSEMEKGILNQSYFYGTNDALVNDWTQFCDRGETKGCYTSICRSDFLKSNLTKRQSFLS